MRSQPDIHLEKEFLDGAEAIFSEELPSKKEDEGNETERLCGKIGQLQIEVDFLKKSWANESLGTSFPGIS